MATDFPVTRALLDELGTWLHELAAPLLPLVQVPEPDGGFHWEFREQTAYALAIAKGIRAVSAIRAAMLLADQGFVTESASLLRMVSDFAGEITAVGEGLASGKPTTAQQRFETQFYEPLPLTPEEFEKQKREFYVSREELMKADVRLANMASVDGEQLRKLKRFLNKGYDSYVHGGYLTAMELYHGGRREFMLSGHEGVERRCIARVAVAGKLHEVVCAFEFLSTLVGNHQLRERIRAGRHSLDGCDEQSNSPCQ